ncbi:MAG: hypothetical protein ACXV7F_12070 [Methylomonas sp.]
MGSSVSYLDMNLRVIARERHALAQYQTQQRKMGDFLAAFTSKSDVLP